MDDSIAISVRNVSKMYRLFASPKQRLLEAFHPFRKKYHHEFWALKDISFDVPRGSTLGIIGRNGSGKSTLLQIICSILAPTSGAVSVKGKISALLELGAGFNPEFTGRDNVVFNGALTGFSRADMEERLHEIESFADIGEFFYQPVKTYSSGMFVRLAFAAAISVDPDILIVDEALAVGDVIFQQKCFKKFNEFKESGKTIVFVSHDLTAISRHCSFVLVLERGGIDMLGSTRESISRYWELVSLKPAGLTEGLVIRPVQGGDAVAAMPERTFISAASGPLASFLAERPDGDHFGLRRGYNKNEHRYGDQRGEIIDFFLESDGVPYPPMIRSSRWLDIYMKTKFNESVVYPNYGFKLRTLDGIVVCAVHSAWLNLRPKPVRRGDVVVFKFSVRMSVAPGDYFIGFGLGDRTLQIEDIPLDRRHDCVYLRVEKSNEFDGIANLDCRGEEISYG